MPQIANSIALVAAVAALLGCAWLLLREAGRRRQGLESLRRAKDELEAQVDARAGEHRESNARLQSIIDSAVDGIIVIDAKGRIESFNRGAERLFGYSGAEVIGRNVNILMPSPDHEQHDGYLARYLATGVHKIIGIGRDVTGVRHDGTTFPVHLSVGEMTVNGERKFTGILHDLSARVRIEEQLREQSTLARLGEMAAVIAHEVKNPLAGIRGAIQVIGGRLPEGSRDAVMTKEIVARIDALNDLMKDLLLFARPPQPRPVPVEIARLVATTVDLLREDPALKGVRVQVDGSAPPIEADPELLKIVFQNLLVNGAHAMQGQGTIRISVTTIDSSCHIAFSDAGPGIPPEIREKIFTPFFTTKSRGSGLGLPTAKRLIEAHHGTITVDCPPSGGTTVSIQLPTESMYCVESRIRGRNRGRAALHQKGVRNFSPMERKSPTLRVLVVEDELLIRWAITEILAESGHTVLEASDGASAIRALTTATEPVDVVLLDYRLPDSNDLTLLATIRRLAPRSSVVLITAYGTPEVTQGALQLGVCRILSKPFDMHDLAQVVLQAYGSRPH